MCVCAPSPSARVYYFTLDFWPGCYNYRACARQSWPNPWAHTRTCVCVSVYSKVPGRFMNGMKLATLARTHNHFPACILHGNSITIKLRQPHRKHDDDARQAVSAARMCAKCDERTLLERVVAVAAATAKIRTYTHNNAPQTTLLRQ